MGAEFLKKRNHGYEKHIDRKRARLAAGDLLTRTPTDMPRRVLVKVRRGVGLAAGEKLLMELRGHALAGCRGNSIVADAENVSTAISEAVISASGVATGTVEKVNAFSGTAEVSIC